MLTVEREISSIETANINKETLDAMKNASTAMKGIHGNLTIDKVDQVMEDLRDQHAVGEEIAEALTQGAVGQGVDEDELDEELAELQQEQLDEQMLRSGTVPQDRVQRLPEVGSGPSKSFPVELSRGVGSDTNERLTSQEQAYSRRRRRGRRAAETAGGDGHVSRGRQLQEFGKEFTLAGISDGIRLFCVHIALIALSRRFYYTCYGSSVGCFAAFMGCTPRIPTALVCTPSKTVLMLSFAGDVRPPSTHVNSCHPLSISWNHAGRPKRLAAKAFSLSPTAKMLSTSDSGSPLPSPPQT